MTNDEIAVRVGGISNWPVKGFVPDPKFPATTEHNYWDELLGWLLHQGVPPGWRVYCGMWVPDFPNVLVSARAAADRCSVSYSSDDTAPAICDRIVLSAAQ